MEVNIDKMAILPKLIYRFSVILTKIPAGFFTELHKLNLKFIQKYKEPRIATTILKKNNKVDRLTLPNFTIYYKATEIKTMWY